MTRLRLAVIGTGHLGRFHSRVATTLPSARLVAVVDPDQAVRERVASETGARPLADFRDLFGLADAAILATPTVMHHAIASELLRGGMHVLVEKPITQTVAEADELVQLAERQQLVLQTGHIERFNPAFTAVKDRLTDPKYIVARRLSGYTGRSTDIGVVHDLMIHDIDLVLSMVQSPLVRVDSVGLCVLSTEEDVVDARLQFASGCVANLTASRVSFQAARSMQVFTDSCYANMDFASRKATLIDPSLEVLSRQLKVASLTAEQKKYLSEHLFQEILVRSDAPVVECNAMEQEQLDFLQAIRTSSEPLVSGAAGRDALAVAEQIQEQLRSHQWDGIPSGRRGPRAMPHSDSVLEPHDPWSVEDTVIIRRKAG